MLWVATAALFIVGFIGIATVGGDDGRDEQEQAVTTTIAGTDTTDVTSAVPTSGFATPTTPTTTVAAPTTGAGTASTSGGPPPTAQPSSQPSSPGSGLGTDGVGDVADGSVPIAETGGLPFAWPGLVALGVAWAFLALSRRARPQS